MSDFAVTAVVINWNGAEHLHACLDHLMAQTYEAFDIVVVDNDSHDDSRSIIEAAVAASDGRVRPIWNATNRGYAGAANDAIAETSAAGLLLLNPDALPAPEHVAELVRSLTAAEDIGAVQGRLWRTERAPTGEKVIDTTGHIAFRTRLFRNRGEGEIDRGQYDDPSEIFGVSGALALYRRSMLEDVAIEGEIFDEHLFAFWEDVDLDWRAAMRGWRAAYVPTALADHERGGAGPRRTARVEQLNYQNRLFTIIKNDAAGPLLKASPGVALTTGLKTIDLLLTVPMAFLGVLGSWRTARVMLRKRKLVQSRATVSSHDVVARWFVSFDYAGWVTTWWRRVRGVPLGTGR